MQVAFFSSFNWCFLFFVVLNVHFLPANRGAREKQVCFAFSNELFPDELPPDLFLL